MNLNDLIEEKLNYYAQKIVSGGSKTDEMAVGEITFYVALRRVVNGKGTRQDVGMMDAINDTLQSLGLVEEGKTFYK
ncbi:MAG: hypothetical protein F6K37_33290 [Moorea sp. SIO4E2]|uniref:hypothetical protein n=1 Tax=Moorena sp. SIO4E2 TaxID=2607826 RepID=UPI0013BC21D1|nr:hypothetical protein [Moorena sp. SIO4E2]NEQ10620.1 hypothetical protein [Moorena sp. SIO4E2]